MKPRSFTPLWWMPRSSSRSTAWWNVACDSANARWCTQPGSVGVRSGWATRSSLVNTVISRPSPGSKYRWLSAALSRFGCSKTNGIPSRPSQKSIDVCRSAPTRVMWWTPWLCSFRIWLLLALDEPCLVVAPAERPERDELHPRLDDERGAQPLTDRLCEIRPRRGAGGELDHHRERRLLLHARLLGPDEDVAAHLRCEGSDDIAHRGWEDVHPADDQHVVGATDAAHTRAGAPARALRHADPHVVAGAEAQERRGLVAEVREHELAARAVGERDRFAALRV